MSDAASGHRGASRRDQLTAVAVAVTLAALGFLPVATWLPGGEADPAFARRWIEWGYGTLVCAGVAGVCAIVARNFRLSVHLDALSFRGRDLSGRGAIRVRDAALFVGSLALYAWIARSVYAAHPLLIDELVQVFQARIFASGRLFAPVDAHPEFFSMLHVVDAGEKVYSQFPPGGPAMLALGELAGATWLVGPACGAVAVVLFARLVDKTDPDASPAFRIGAPTLFAVTPFAAFMFGSHMNHAPTLMWLLVAMVGLAHVVSGDRSFRWGAALACGFGFGAAATIRPLDALAFALPAACWLVVRAARDPRLWRDAMLSLAGVAVPFAAMMWVNQRTTGSPFLFGYEVLWGNAHGLGFHAAPWGMAHTPGRGLELVSLYVTRLNSYLFESPFPALAPAIASLALTRRFVPFDRYLIAAGVLLAGLYLAYWHDGFFLGPRFVFAWVPALVLLTARLPRLVATRSGSTIAAAALWGALVTGGVLALTTSLPVRLAQYRGGLTSMREDYSAEAARASVSGALVFVRESWGAQLIARMWAAGVSRSAAAAFYSKVDACALDRALREIERTGARGSAAEARFVPLLADSSRVRSSPYSPDSTEKILPGAAYDPTCVARINEDREGYALLPPIALERKSGNLYARDLHARDSLLLAAEATRPVYLLRRDGAEAGAPLRWLPLKRDSLLASWRSGAP